VLEKVSKCQWTNNYSKTDTKNTCGFFKKMFHLPEDCGFSTMWQMPATNQNNHCRKTTALWRVTDSS